MLKAIKTRIANLLLKNLLKAITLNEALRFDKLSSEEKRFYAEEARLITNTKLYHAISSDIKQRAHEKMFIKSNNFDDMMFGKAMLYNLDLIDQTLNAFKKIQN
jgi:hypothetical protein